VPGHSGFDRFEDGAVDLIVDLVVVADGAVDVRATVVDSSMTDSST